MSKILRYNCILLLLLAVAVMPVSASTPPVPATPPGRVVDLADIIDTPLQDKLTTVLRELEEKTTIQMVILTIQSLDGEDINSFSLATAEQWKLGQQGKDNGLLLTVSVADKKYRFETGYGLESVLPDSLLGSIGRKSMVPYFKQEKYGLGIAAATRKVLSVLARRQGTEFSATGQLPSSPAGNNSNGAGLVIFFILLILFIIIVNARRKNRRTTPGTGPIIFPVGWGSGGGFGSGGFGGGFGGGGGGFGGGGVSGGW
jgi:uncharacterized protein